VRQLGDRDDCASPFTETLGELVVRLPSGPVRMPAPEIEPPTELLAVPC